MTRCRAGTGVIGAPRARKPALRARRPPAERRRRDPRAAPDSVRDHRPARGRQHRRARADPSRRGLPGRRRGRRAAPALPPRGRLRRLGHVHDRRPVRVPADARRARPASDRRGPPRGGLRPPRRARPRAPRRDGHRVCGVGAGRARGQRRRRLQLLGRTAARDAHARLDRDLGAVPARRGAGRPLQVRDPRRRRRADAEGRSVRAGGRAPAEDGVGGHAVPPRVEPRRRTVAARAPRRRAARRADVDLRGARRLVAAEHARGQPLADLPRARRRAVGVRQGHGLHACRAAAGDAPPVLGLVGLPGDRLLRAFAALRLARRLPRSSSTACTQTGWA